MINGGPIRIAVADDHELYRNGLCDHLRLQGMEVILTACDGRALIQGIEALPNPPDICILDIHMAPQDGIVTASQINRRWPTVPLLLMSMDIDAAKGLMYPFLEKGGDPDLLGLLVRRLVETKREPDTRLP